jgi:hypothetical protein
MADPNPIDTTNSPLGPPPYARDGPVALPYATPAPREKKLGNASAMVLIAFFVGTASVFIFVACVVNHQEAWPAAAAAGALSGMGTMLCFFLTRGR